MDERLYELIDDLKGKLDPFYKTSIFSKPETDLASLLEACRSLLVYRGFKVVDQELPKVNVKNVDDLIKYFYTLKERYHPEDKMTHITASERDRHTAKYFVKARMDEGAVSRDIALRQCVKIIKIIFEYENKFKFRFPISFSIFGQKKLGWITELALSIASKEALLKEEKARDAIVSAYERAMEDQIMEPADYLEND